MFCINFTIAVDETYWQKGGGKDSDKFSRIKQRLFAGE